VTTERFTLALDRPEAQFRDQPQNVRFLGKVKPEANRIGGKGTARQQCSFDRAFSLFDPLLYSSRACCRGDDILCKSRNVRHDEAGG
jgi:hypothetical protein